MGLFDMLNTDEGLLGLSLLAAASPKPRRTSTGEGLLQAMQFVQQNKDQRADREQRARMLGLQEQQLMQALEAQKRAQEQAQQRQRYLGSVDPMQGPAMPVSMAGGMAAGLAPQEVAALSPQKPRTMTLKPGEQVFSEDGKPLFGVPEKADKAPEALRTLALIYGEGSPEYMQAARALGQKLTTHQPGTKVEVNTGQKGFDNTLKLRGDFRSEPVYKAHQEMQSAYSQIQQSLKQASPAGDLAGATKIMKLLDPGSVVRESELGMAMAASGLLDRLQNYAQNVLKGTKLTPTQRADFQRLADALYGESVKQFNSKRSEYQAIAERNQLNVMDVLGPESAAPQSRVVNFGDLK